MAAIFSCNLILLAGSIAFLTVRVWHGLWFVPFNDEAEHLLGGRVLNVGGHLYQTYIDYHGPVIFMLAQAYGALFGWSAPNYARLILPLLSALAAASIALSPALRSATEKCLGVSLFAGLLAAVWLVQGLYSVSFYPVAGLFAVIGIAAYLAAAWRNLSVPLPLALIAGLSFSLLAFTAYSFGPSVVLFTVSGIWSSMRQKSATLALIVGVAAGGFGVLIWLLFYGDLVGYIVYHIIFNQTVYAPFILHSVIFFGAWCLPYLHPRKYKRLEYCVAFCPVHYSS
ncbi:MAG TPA: hypothetical protein VHD86_25575 [Xanthobacteraceae bacterium]|nr:hypothetical protein [Xanthobacteraceae bacterium]